MAILYVLQSGRTDWDDAKRFESAAGAPLSEAGAAVVHELAEVLAAKPIKAVYSSPSESDSQTAGIVAQRMNLKPAGRPELRELDYGLWQGLLVGEVKHRYGKVYRMWRESPDVTCPPGGETFHDAQDRCWGAVRKVIKRHRGRDVLIVLQPLAAALLNCKLLGEGVERIWENVDWLATWRQYDLERISLTESIG